MSINSKLNVANLDATDEEKLLMAADIEIEELSDHSRPMLVNNINEA